MILELADFLLNIQPHYPVEPRVAIGSAQNEAENCYQVANARFGLFIKKICIGCIAPT